ncbi:DedA family protein [Candidatus Falkowbacteria bacterium]|jgi:membrane protein DedA with SNARE-associated domain|nr:DedA family protein [Candidatus Falkowbacteria bacterium]
MLNALLTWILNITEGLGYLGIVILMAVESSFLPLPSEVVIPPAAYLASQGKMNLVLIILFGTLGSILGATFNYVLSLIIGRPLIYKLASHRFARFLLISPEKIERAEKYFLTNAKSATFLGRLLPVIRHLISIPAGFSRMPYGSFVLFTALGAFIWVSILAFLGYFIGENQALFAKYYQETVIILLAIGALFVIRQIRKKKKRETEIINSKKQE